MLNAHIFVNPQFQVSYNLKDSIAARINEQKMKLCSTGQLLKSLAKTTPNKI